VTRNRDIFIDWNEIFMIHLALTEGSEKAASLSEVRDRAVQHTEHKVRNWLSLSSACNVSI